MHAPPDSTENPRGFGGTPDPEPETDADGNEYATEDEQLDYDLLTVFQDHPIDESIDVPNDNDKPEDKPDPFFGDWGMAFLLGPIFGDGM